LIRYGQCTWRQIVGDAADRIHCHNAGSAKHAQRLNVRAIVDPVWGHNVPGAMPGGKQESLFAALDHIDYDRFRAVSSGYTLATNSNESVYRV
jgi:hypothetical protein